MKIVKAEGKFSIDLKKTIVLVGIMGAGKTTIGKNLADRLQLQFLDADKEIEEAAGCTISEFFEKYGEEEFRKGEERVIARILGGNPCVLATGGGAFISRTTRLLINKTATSLWLRVSFEVLAKRLEEINQKVLLSKSNLKRSEKKLPLAKSTSLCTMLDNLNPPNIPIPSP